ncbi:RimJ/RimL family protein N-acetyltransferase [Paraburkholderia terricola]|uniref:GNAT family N-acetyltransferase n=1 Tax=Paraburkholderia terricola TaxID=169427 RepID=UPI00285A5EC1|nr:GNAT family protein [Paraburkholderia terricola]MDR6448585.1 RimJ/RimL family protein N-acetyltransferase [Paraburkholderia terricola]
MSTFRFPGLIESDELLMRPPEPRDAQALFDDMLSDVATTRDLSFARHTQLDETLAFIDEAQEGWRTGTLIRWVLEDRASSRLTGLIELRPHPPRVELGVVISRRGGARRRRAGLYALRKLLKWLIAQPPFLRVFAYCAVDGDAHSSMERLGFTLEAKLTNHECRPNRGLIAADSYLYAMTRPLHPPSDTPAMRWLEEHTSLETI